ncbi:hypothetical protein QMZ05_24230 [Bradyrhizobium sp. INPA03-11B]|uniref:hypothetical protein n=1 Tax=Bradyrhizobium sp. INPA03-11B TaxID=418598 RepID=UPI00338D5854
MRRATKCVCCSGVIDGLADDAGVGFDARIGLFTDERTFVCNECTASLIAAAARRQEAVRRRS